MKNSIQKKPTVKIYIRTLVIALWLCMVTWLIRYEAFPDYFTHSLNGYRSLFDDDVLIMDSWMKILFKGAPIGYSHTSMETDEFDPIHRHEINSQVNMSISMMGERQGIYVNTSARLNLMYQMQDFKFNMSTHGYTMRLNAERAADSDKFNVTISTPNTSQKSTIIIPDDVILYSPMTEMAMKNLHPGQKMTVKTIDPTTLATTTLTIQALRKELISIAGKEYAATVLSTEYGGMTAMSWIDTDGIVLRQETPFGWTMEKCSPEEATSMLRTGEAPQDILAGMAVRCKGKLRNPRGCNSIRLKLTGVHFAPDELLSHRQNMEKTSGYETDLTVSADKTPALSETGLISTNGLQAFLDPSPAIQSDHPDIINRSKSITGVKTNVLEKAVAILDWIYSNVEPQMTISLPSALDVLKTMKGDCNECTYLFVALARAAGIPSKINVGLAYHENAFYYHAWPSVFVGRWLEMDPTPSWGQAAVDATHISLVQGELQDQIKLLKVIGQLQIEILEEK